MVNFFAKLSRTTVHQSIALFLCLWMSGAMCAVSCCPTDIASLAKVDQALEAASVSVEMDASCPMHQQSAEKHVNKNSEANQNSFAPLPKNPSRLECCALTAFFTNVSKQISQTDISTVIASLPAKFNFPATERCKITFQKTSQTIPRTRGDTYLRNCVFLI